MLTAQGVHFVSGNACADWGEIITFTPKPTLTCINDRLSLWTYKGTVIEVLKSLFATPVWLTDSWLYSAFSVAIKFVKLF